MKVELLAVGTEMLLGHTVNTNASEIGGRLAEAGLDHHRQVVVGDNLDRIADAIRSAMDAADALIITGGLGPTQDDLTREAISAATGRPLVRSTEWEHRLRELFARRGRKMPAANLQQADYPEGGVLIDNPKGSAPGLDLPVDGCRIFALPGVPAEMITMLETEVIPRLVEMSGTSGGVIESRVLRTHGESESRVAEILDDLFHASGNPSVAFLASAGEIKVRLTARAEDRAMALALISPLEEEVMRRLGPLVFAVGSEPVASIIMRAAAAHGWTIGTAESVTGGSLAAAFTAVPGASATFRGGLVAYASELKGSLLEVAAETIEAEGVVSEATALAMAEGGARLLGTEVCVATTGSAGPERQEREVGTLIVAVRTPDGLAAKTLRLPGDRERVRAYGTTAALHLARRAVAGEWWD